VELDELYRELILDHYQHPRHFGTLENASVRVGLHNPTCGDRIAIDLDIVDGVIQDASFSGQGCSISMASASMLTDAVIGRTVGEAEQLAQGFIDYLTDQQGVPPAGDFEALNGVKKFPARVKCATLAHNALRQAVRQWRDNLEA